MAGYVSLPDPEATRQPCLSATGVLEKLAGRRRSRSLDGGGADGRSQIGGSGLAGTLPERAR